MSSASLNVGHSSQWYYCLESIPKIKWNTSQLHRDTGSLHVHFAEKLILEKAAGMSITTYKEGQSSKSKSKGLTQISQRN